MDVTGKPTSRHIRGVWWVVFGSLVVLMVLLIVLPLAVQFALTRALHQMGAEQVEIHDVDLNLFTATFGVQSLSLSGPDGATASLGDLRVAWRWRSLLDRRFDLTAVEISGLTLPVSQHGTQWRLAGIELPASGQDEEGRGEWGLALRHLVLEKIDLPVELASSTQRLVIDRLVLSSLVSWTPETAGTGRVRGRINGTGFQLDSDLRLFADLPDSELRLSFEALSLEPFARLTGLEGLSGELSANTTVEIGQTRAGGLRVSHTGEISLHDALVPVADDGQIRVGSGKLAGALELAAGDAGQTEIIYTGDLSFGQGALSLAGAAHDTHATQPAISVALDAGSVSGALRFALSDAAPGDVRFTGTVDLARLDVTATGMQVGTDAANWSGDIAVTIPDQGPLYEVTGEFTAEETSLQLDNGFSGTVAAARWDGSIATATGQPVPTLTGAISADGFAVRRDPQGPHLVTVKRIGLGEVSGLPTQQLRAAALHLSGVDALELETATDSARAVVADGDVQLGPMIVTTGEQGTRVEVTRAAVEGVAVTIRRLADGRLAGFNHLESTDPSAAPATVPDSEAASSDPGFTLAVDELVVAPGSRISFQDQGVSPRFNALAEVTELQVTQIDTRERGRLSPYRVAATVNEFGKLELAGDVQLFSADPTLTAKGSVSGIGLPPLSSYTVPAIGYNLTSGQLSADIDFRFDEGVIDGALDLRLANIQVASAQNKKTQRTLRLLGSPLESALDTVRDSKNNVRLTLPVRGNLQDPQFDLSNVMGTAMVGAVQSAVLTYVKVSVLPLAALGTVLDVVGATTQIQLSPVEFVAGESTPREQGFDDYLTALAGVAGDRPGLRFRLCGLATGADASGDDDAGADELLTLAGDRASLIKRRLIGDKGIAAERLFICQPQVVDDDSPPRVEVRVDK